MKAQKDHVLLLACLVLLLAACSSNSTSASSTTSSTAHTSLVSCTFHTFRATVLHGPDAGVALQGDLQLDL